MLVVLLSVNLLRMVLDLNKCVEVSFTTLQVKQGKGDPLQVSLYH